MEPASDHLSLLARPAFSNLRLNPYNAAIYGNIAGYGVDVHEYSLLRALRDRHHVVHVHWPESTFNHTLVEALATTQSLLWMLRWQRRRGARIMWTVHNLRAHDAHHRDSEDRFWNAFVKLVDGFIVMQRGALEAVLERFPVLKERHFWIVPHPHYRDHYPDTTDRAEARSRLGLDPDAATFLFFGRLYPYKNASALVQAFRNLPNDSDRRFQLIVAGAPRDRALADAIRQQAADDDRIRIVPRFIGLDETQFYFRACDLVVLPYRDILNSGAAVLALSFDRPVLLPDSIYQRDLAARVEGPWVMGYDALTASALTDALSAVASLPERSHGRHLSSFSPERVTEATVAAYRDLTQSAPH